jgi:hypothetical protein
MIEAPVTISDAERPIGTHVFTALERNGAELRWSVVSMPDGGPAAFASARAPERGGRDVAPTSPDASAARAALDRIALPPEILAQVGDMASPRSSLIISDEPLSPETGPETEFVVILSGEPQGSMKVRRRTAGR